MGNVLAAPADRESRRVAREIERELQAAHEPGEKCACELRTVTTLAELRALGAGCTSPLYACRVLVTIRRRLGA